MVRISKPKPKPTPLLALLFGISLLCPWANATYNLEFDAKRNEVDIIGPYIRYNFLKKPYSFGAFPFSKSDVRLEVSPGTDGKPMISAVWPEYFLSNGEVTLYSAKNKAIASDSFKISDVSTGDGKNTYKMSIDFTSLKPELEKGVHFCVEDDLPISSVEVCSDKLALKEGQFAPLKTSDDVRVLLNNKKVPTNAQINLSLKDEKFALKVKFRSGLKIRVVDEIEALEGNQVYVDIENQKVGISSTRRKFHTDRMTIGQKVKRLIKEKNYYRESFNDAPEWPQDLTGVEMEFAPFEEAARLQMYGLSFSEVPQRQFALKLNENSPIATYSNEVVLKGVKAKDEQVFSLKKGKLKISKDKTKFLWTFHAPEKGTVNRDSLVYSQKKGEKFFFSRRVYRGHQASVSASAALGSGPDLSLVPGFQLNADYWPETLWGQNSLFFQRWGFNFSKVQTFSKFSVNGSDEKWSTDWLNFDIMARFTPGVRPVVSTFGLGFRYMNPTFSRSVSEDLSPQLLGIGGFWHTAPQKFVDDVFSTVPFFRYPKWMEISLYFYPVTLSSGFTLGLAFSYTARGRLYFAQNWFLDASANVHSISFRKEGDVQATVATAQATIGVGYNF